MRQRFALTLATAALLANSAFAADGLDKAVSATYQLDKTHANVIFNLAHMGMSRYFGRFNALDGKLEFDAKAPEKSKLNITVNMNTVDTNNDTLESELKDKDWFDTAKYPTATFTSTKVEKLSDSKGKVTGDLTLHGVTKPVTLDVTFNGAGQHPMMKGVDMLGFSATTSIKRSEFGVSKYIPMVGDDVTLTIEAEFHHKGETAAAK